MTLQCFWLEPMIFRTELKRFARNVVMIGLIKYIAELNFAQDLHASDAVYRQVCSSNFRTGKQIPGQYRSAIDAKPEQLSVQ